jgi:hypothetical protein
MVNSTSRAKFDSAWISQFISTVNVHRGDSILTPCANLDSFAMLGFKTLNNGSNWEIIHFGYSVDLQHTYGGTAGSYAEEYFYPITPSYRSPGGFAQYVQTNASGHWDDLVNPLFTATTVCTRQPDPSSFSLAIVPLRSFPRA